MMKVKMSEAFDLQIGKTPARNNAAYWGGKRKWISVADIGNSGKYIYETKEMITDVGVRESGIRKVPKGTVVMSFKLSIGKTAIVAEDMYTNEAIVAFIDKKEYPVDSSYLYHMCNGINWTEKTNKAVMGLVLNKAILSEQYLMLPDLNRQCEIAKILDKIDMIIATRQKQVEELDYLIKARFVEMFGDEENMKTMSEVCSIITDGTHQPPKFRSEGIPFIFVSNIIEDNVTYDVEKYIDEATYDELVKRTPIEIGDVLLSTVGSYGHPAVVKSDRKFLFQRHIAYLKPRRDVINSDYLHGAILSPSVQKQIENGVKGIAQKTLNLSEIKKMVIPVPSLTSQEKFSDFVTQTDKSKAAIKKSLEKLETLKKSLMQKYFG